MLTRGIILIATGHPFYGRLAYNLAVSIKSVEETQITVLHNGRGLAHLSEQQLKIFDEVRQISQTWFETKLWLVEFTPYDQTLYLDSDMLWLPQRRPSELFDELKNVTFTSITEGYYDYTSGVDHSNKMYYYWLDNLDEVKQAYGITDRLYQWRSEVMYFTKAAKPLFDLAREIYNNPKVKIKKFADHIPDEAAFNLAAAIMNLEPHEFRWRPAYWHRLHGEGKQLPQLLKDYYLLSFGGNFASRTMKTCYTNICKSAHRRLGLQFLFALQSKKEVMPDRVKM